MRKGHRYLALGIAIAALGVTGTTAAAKPLVLAATRHVVSCGKATTITSPAPEATSNASDLAASLGLSPSDPGVRRAALQHVKWLDTISCRGHVKDQDPHARSLGLRTSGGYTSGVWSGYVTTSTSSPNDVEAEWHVPSVQFS